MIETTFVRTVLAVGDGFETASLTVGPSQSLSEAVDSVQSSAVVESTLTTVIDCNGKPLTISTTQKPGESTKDFVARHEAAVASAKAACEAGGPA